MKLPAIALILFLLIDVLPAQEIKPCVGWLTGYIGSEPKISDGTRIDKYIVEKLASDTSLKNMATCMVGLKIYSNCNGEFSYVKQEYANKPLLLSQCKVLLQKAESIMNGINHFTPGTIGGQPKDFTFKLVVWVKHNGRPAAEILY